MNLSLRTKSQLLQFLYGSPDVWGNLISSSVKSSCFQTGPVEQTTVVTVHPVQLVHQLGEYAILTQFLRQFYLKYLVRFEAYLTATGKVSGKGMENFE